MSSNNIESITNDDPLPLTIEEKYKALLAKRSATIKKYHQSDKGKVSLKKSAITYYNKNKAKILQKKREKYKQKKLEKLSAN